MKEKIDLWVHYYPYIKKLLREIKIAVILVVVCVTSVSGSINDQERRVTGKVTDNSGNALIGVSVVVKGTTTGIITDLEGNYSLAISQDATTLSFSFVGMTSQDIAIGNQSVINVVLTEDAIGLEEVVVIGYGTVKRKDLTGSVSSVSDQKFADRPVSRIDQALVGAVPGLDIVSSGSRPGAGSTILLRGKRSFTASNDPLLIVDGMPFYGSLNDINPSDVKSIDVLKDASSTAIYGSRGANGVIILTTKRGQVSKPTFTLESSAGPELMFGRIPLANGQNMQNGEEKPTAHRVATPIPKPIQPMMHKYSMQLNCQRSSQED